MNISEVEKITGINKQAIRFYEKEGLISPKRNEDNSYRVYDAKEIRELKLIRVLRNTGMSVEDVRSVLEGRISLNEAVNTQRVQIENERKELASILELCDELKTQDVEKIDADYYMTWIQREEKSGNVFIKLWEDYKQVAKGEAVKKFYFIQNQLVNTPRDFTNALLEYAKLQNAEITITKESMYPEFVWNGIEYSALRIHGRYGSKIFCEMLYPELAEAAGVDENRKKVLKLVVRIIPILVFLACFLFVALAGR